MSMKLVPALCLSLLLSACQGHHLTKHEQVFARVCGNHSCPAPGISRPTVSLEVAGRPHLAPETVAVRRPLTVTLTVTPERGSRITRFWIAEAGMGQCCSVTDAGPTEGHVLFQGAALSTTPVSFTWTPATVGHRLLVLGYYATAPEEAYEDDGYAGLPLGNFTVRP